MAAVAALCEVLAGLAMGVLETRLPFPEPRLYFGGPVSLGSIAKNFDPLLGWITPYDTPYGERRRAIEYDRPLVSAFGDSFTHGDEVAATQTWAEVLAASLGGDVFNFGVGGYGMDQALLRFERDQPKRPTPIVLFAFTGVELRRCFQRYWTFHNPHSFFPMAKPRLLLKNGSLELLPNPVATSRELYAGLNDAAFIERLAREDAWFNPHGLPPIRRPYLAIFARPSLWRAAFAVRTPRDPWSEPDGVRLAELILERFARVALARGARPVIVQLPGYADLVAYVEHGKVSSVTAQTRAICERNGLECVFPIFSEPAGPIGERSDYFVRGTQGGHYSVRGNRWIGLELASQLRRLAPDVVVSDPVQSGR